VFIELIKSQLKYQKKKIVKINQRKFAYKIRFKHVKKLIIFVLTQDIVLNAKTWTHFSN